MRRPLGDNDRFVTLRVSRSAVAFIFACALHVGAWMVSSRLPEPKPAERRIDLTIVQPAPTASPNPTSAASRPRRPPRTARVQRPASPPPALSPVLPSAPADTSTPVPVAEQAPPETPLPPVPSTWEERLHESLRASRSSARIPAALAPSPFVLEQVANADPRLHDEETEQRLAEDHGPFLRRGLDALRGHWHPQRVLDETEGDPSRRCGRRMARTTFAVAVLDRDGDVVDVDLRSESGCEALDQEAFAAFMRVARFPHPPEGIFVAPDGTPSETARFPVRFIVSFNGDLRIDWGRW